MKWRKGGLLFAPDGAFWWARSSAILPTVQIVNKQEIRVYFAALDENKYGRIGYVDLDSSNPTKVLHLESEPVLDVGDPGTFDDCGVVPSCILNIGGRRHLYYVGFQRAERVPYMLFTGLAIADPGGRFARSRRTPVLDRTDAEPFSRAAPCIVEDEGELKMWYWSCTHWSVTNNRIHYNNVIRYATSSDGVSWKTHDNICLRPTPPDEFSLGRPSVIRDLDGYRMWYAIRSFSRLYRIGYAESDDGIHWVRRDEHAGIDVSQQGWDSEMICYPCVVKSEGRFLMFYNGNGHGSTGFGYATLEI